MQTLADLSLVTGRHEDARTWLDQAIALERRRVTPRGRALAFLLSCRSEVAALEGDFEASQGFARLAAEASTESLPFPPCTIGAHVYDLFREGHVDAAYDTALRVLPAIQNTSGTAGSLCTRSLERIIQRVTESQ
jgi:hypothetical protein